MTAGGVGYEPGSETLVLDTVRDLSARGYEGQFQVTGRAVRCQHCGRLTGPEDLEVDEVHRFEGESNPDDEAVVVALHCRACGWRGTLVTGYGPSVPEGDAEFLASLAATLKR
jgi:hypothetical protein